MNDFKVIYKILKVLHESMDFEELDPVRISADVLGITDQRRKAIFAMLQENGYIAGVYIARYADKGGKSVIIDPSKIEITLKGIEYLNENSLMKKAANMAKGMIDIIS